MDRLMGGRTTGTDIEDQETLTVIILLNLGSSSAIPTSQRSAPSPQTQAEMPLRNSLLLHLILRIVPA